MPADPVNPWEAFEAIPCFEAVPAVWERKMGLHFRALNAICLEPADWQVCSYPCPLKCGCWHRVVLRHDNTVALGICECDPPTCPDQPLTMADITPLKISWTRLARELCRAFGFQSKFLKLVPPHAHQIGSWSTDAVPAILTIQVRNADFRSTVAQLAALLRRSFILFAPTTDQIDATSQTMLENCGAAFYALDSHVIINPSGTLAPVRPPGELFARFTPQSEKPLPAIVAKPRYALRKGLGVWHLIFDGQEASLRHERGIFYVAWLLYNPPEQPIHGVDLAAKIPEIYRRQLGLLSVAEPVTGKVPPMQSDARIQERSLALDDAEAMRAVFKKEKELEAILDDESESEPVKAEALRELEAIAEFQRENGHRCQDSAGRAARAVRGAIKRLHEHLTGALDQNGGAHPVLGAFAEHIERHILVPSARYSGHGGPYARKGLAGCFTYEGPGGVIWPE